MNDRIEKLKETIAAAAKRTRADIVIKNGKIVDVFTLSLIEADIAISAGMIVGIGHYEGEREIDAKGCFICPGFIDGHMHIESSMVQPTEYAKTVLPHGVTTVITDPHEIANVSGIVGIEYMLEASEGIPLDVFFMLPSCVPVAPFENTGATLHAPQLAPLYEHDRVLGLGEVMNFPAVAQGDHATMQKISDAHAHQKIIDGHAAGVAAEDVNVYMTAGIRTDHECVTAAEALDRVQRGMYVMLREGTASKDPDTLLEAVNERNARRFLFVTDDKHLDELLTEGSIDHNIRLAIRKGLDPLLAIQMATLNAAECFRLEKKGAVAPGYEADLVFIENLHEMTIAEVYKAGKLVAQDGNCLTFPKPKLSRPKEVIESINMAPIQKDQLQIKCKVGQKANVIEVIPNSIVTNHLIEEVKSEDGVFQPSLENDQLKLVVIERHNNKGNIGLGIVKGFQLKGGALISSVAHDSHNLVAVGTNDDDLFKAIEMVRELGGGQLIVNDGHVVSSVPLPLSGLMSERNFEKVNEEIIQLNKALGSVGFTRSFNPFSALSFLALPVIPSLKLTDSGLFHVESFKHIPVFADEERKKGGKTL